MFKTLDYGFCEILIIAIFKVSVLQFVVGGTNHDLLSNELVNLSGANALASFVETVADAEHETHFVCFVCFALCFVCFLFLFVID